MHSNYRIMRNIVNCSFIGSMFLFTYCPVHLAHAQDPSDNTRNRGLESYAIDSDASILSIEERYGMTLDTLHKLFNSTYSDEQQPVPSFTETDVIEFLQLPGSLDDKLDYIGDLGEETSDAPLDGFNIRRYYQLGVDPYAPDSFQDTKKPNMLYVLPRYDPLPIRSFETVEALALFKQLQEVYDTAVLVASTESEVYQALEQIPSLELVVLSGHGTRQAIQLSYDESHTIDTVGNGHGDISAMDEMTYNRIDELMIDIRDTELKEYLDTLPFRSTLFLNSCSTGEGGQSIDNLANAIMEMAAGHVVIAATGPFSAYDVRLYEEYPLDLQIVVDRNVPYLTYVRERTRNITYSNRIEDISNQGNKPFFVEWRGD